MNQETETLEEPTTRDITQVRQVPHWKTDSQFVITGQEFLELQNFFNMFASPIQVVNNIFKRGLDDKTIQVRFLDNNDNEFTQEEVATFLKNQQ